MHLNVADRIRMAELNAAKAEMRKIASESRMTDWEGFQFDDAMASIEREITDIEVRNGIRCEVCGERYTRLPIESESNLREGSNEIGSIACRCGLHKCYGDWPNEEEDHFASVYKY